MSTDSIGVRNCPVCKSGLRPIHIEQVTIDFCPQCRGSWFDMNELHRAYERKDALSTLLLPAVPHLVRDPVLCTNCGEHGPRSEKTCAKCKSLVEFSCPNCHEPLEIKNRHGLDIDCCRKCKGIWLDGGELRGLFEQYSKSLQQKGISSEAAVAGAAAADVALDMFIWAPDLYIAATAQVLTQLPELASKGIEIAGDLPEIASNMPEIAATAAEGLMNAAGSAAELATGAISGAIEIAGNAGSAASDAAASFIEVILDLVSGIFD